MIAAAVALMCLGTLAFVVAGVYALLAARMYVRDDIRAVRDDLRGSRRLGAGAPRAATLRADKRPLGKARADGVPCPEGRPAGEDEPDTCGRTEVAPAAPEAGGTAQPEVETSPPGVPDDGSLKCAFRVTRRVIALSSDDVIVMPPEGPGLGAKGEGPGCRLDEPTFVVDEGVSA